MEIDGATMDAMTSSKTSKESSRHTVSNDPPCDLGCEHRERCAASGELCKRMMYWLETERVDELKPCYPYHPITHQKEGAA